jgi:alkylhydroperoxidase family enzyme
MFRIGCPSTYLAGESHADLSGSHNGICAGEIEAGTRTIAAGFWFPSQPCCLHFKLAETRDRPVDVFEQVHSSSLTEQEIQIVLLTDAVANTSAYAVAFHADLALQQGVNPEAVTAIRERRTPKDQRYAALSTLAKALIEKRGHLSEPELDAFLGTGFTKEQIMEVIAVVAASTITNYAGTIANPPLESKFQQFAWRG